MLKIPNVEFGNVMNILANQTVYTKLPRLILVGQESHEKFGIRNWKPVKQSLKKTNICFPNLNCTLFKAKLKVR